MTTGFIVFHKYNSMSGDDFKSLGFGKVDLRALVSWNQPNTVCFQPLLYT